MRVLLFLAVCCAGIAACACIGFWLTGLLFTGSGYELGSKAIGQFVGAFAAGALGFMAIASLSMRCSKWLTEFFDPLRQ